MSKYRVYRGLRLNRVDRNRVSVHMNTGNGAENRWNSGDLSGQGNLLLQLVREMPIRSRP